MSHHQNAAIAIDRPTLELSGVRQFSFQALLLLSTVILPMAARMAGISVRMFLPMHWPVLMAGLVYGWRVGAVTGLLAPVLNHLVSGYPLIGIVPSMSIELMTYGMMAGVLRERLHWNPFFSLAGAVVMGRIVFVASIFVWNVVPENKEAYFRAALVPGVAAAVLQIFVLPILAGWWISASRKKNRQEKF